MRTYSKQYQKMQKDNSFYFDENFLYYLFFNLVEHAKTYKFLCQLQFKKV